MKKLLFVLLMVASAFALTSCSSQDVVLSPNTTYYGNYSADGHITSSSSGKSFEYFPANSVFTNTYRIKNGNEVWSEYGKVAKISMRSNGSISIGTVVNC